MNSVTLLKKRSATLIIGHYLKISLQRHLNYFNHTKNGRQYLCFKHFGFVEIYQSFWWMRKNISMSSLREARYSKLKHQNNLQVLQVSDDVDCSVATVQIINDEQRPSLKTFRDSFGTKEL